VLDSIIYVVKDLVFQRILILELHLQNFIFLFILFINFGVFTFPVEILHLLSRIRIKFNLDRTDFWFFVHEQPRYQEFLDFSDSHYSVGELYNLKHRCQTQERIINVWISFNQLLEIGCISIMSTVTFFGARVFSIFNKRNLLILLFGTQLECSV
jgi:hypothetical protein